MMSLQRALGAFLTAAIALATVLQPARAASPSTSDLLTKFNAFVLGNYQTSSESEGPVIIGGNLSGSGTFMNFGLPLGVTLAGFGSVNVFGSAGTGNFNANGLAVKVGGPNAGSTFSGAASVAYNATFPATKTEMWSRMTTLSAGLANLAPTTAPGALPAAGSNNAVLQATPATVNGVANVAVIDIAASLLGSYTGIGVALNGAGTVIINVAGNFTGNANFLNGAAWRNNVIWNFENATAVNLGAYGMQGTVLAPFATVTHSNPIDGALVAAAYSGTSELHFQPFGGSKPFLDSFTSVPEPGSLALLAAGLAAIGIARRRR